MDRATTPDTSPAPDRAPATTDCCIVGGGPAGLVLAYLLARRGVDVTLLESHLDFDRDFRGDTLHPSSLEMLDEIGLADRLLENSHTRMSRFVMQTSVGSFALADFTRLKSKFPYVALLAQVKFLNFLATEAEKYANFHLIMGAAAKELIEEDDVCRGVEYQTKEGRRELRARVTVAADGRKSLLRKKAGLTPEATSPPMDVVWFKLPRRQDDPISEEATFRVGAGHATVVLDRDEVWQIAWIIDKGGYGELKKRGVEAFRAALRAILPELVDRVDEIQSFADVSVLAVESNMLERWHAPGLLFIGDAAHAMSPVGGVGINYAIQDAVEAANVLAEALLSGADGEPVAESALARVQEMRQGPVRFMQRIQAVMQRRIVARSLDPSRPFKPPFVSRFGVFQRGMARLLAYGIHTAHLDEAFDAMSAEQEAAHV